MLDTASTDTSKLIDPIPGLALITGIRRDVIRLGRAKTEARGGRTIPMGPTIVVFMTVPAHWYIGEFGPLQLERYAFPSFDRLKPVDPARPIVLVKEHAGNGSRNGRRRVPVSRSSTRFARRWLRQESRKERCSL